MEHKLREKGFIGKFLSTALEMPEATAIEVHGTGESFTYQELLQKAETWQSRYRALEEKKGSMVLLLLPSGPELAGVFYGVVSAGGIAIPLNPHLTECELEKILLDARPPLIITTGEIFNRLHHSFTVLKKLHSVVITDNTAVEATDNPPFSLIRAAELTGQRRGLEIPDNHQPVTCHYTYKGVGYPLGVVHVYDHYNRCLKSLKNTVPYHKGAVYLNLLLVHYVYSLTMSLLFPLSYGCKIVMVPSIKHENLLQLMEQYQVNMSTLVPQLFRKLSHEAYRALRKGKKINLPSSPVLISGGSYLDAGLSAKVLENTGIEPLQGYGLTETLPITCNTAENPRRGTLGVPFSEETSIFIMNENKEKLPAGQTGEIAVSGPTLADGYHQRPEETNMFFQEGLFYTGDLGYLDEDGHLNFTGRKQPFTKVSALMVDLTEVEKVLMLHPCVKKVRATVYQDPYYGENIQATLLLNHKAGTDQEEMFSFCRKRLSLHKVPRKFIFRHDFSS